MKSRKNYINTTMRLLLVFIASFFTSIHSNAQSETWNANWIWTSDIGPNNTWVNLRKKVSLSGKPSSAVTRIAAENKYWLYVNGILVVNDGGLEVRPDLVNTYYDEIDIAPYLNDGNNIISALVWHKGGPECYTQITLDNGGFIFESELTGSSQTSILSDETWKIKVDSAFMRGVFTYKYNVSGTVQFSNAFFGGDPLDGVLKAGYYRPVGSTVPFIKCADENGSFTLPGNSDVAYGSTESPFRIWNSFKWLAYPVTYDARNETSGWNAYDFDDSSWENATEKGVPPVAPWNTLVHRTIPFWKDYGLTSYSNEASFPASIISNTTITANVDKNIQGTPYFKINAPAGITLRIVLNEFYYQDYITKDGEQEFECYAWQNSSDHTVKYQFINVSGEVEILDLKFRQTSYNTEVIGSFESNDAALNTLWDKCKNTSQVCMRDFFFDCPNRERGQWWGDVSEQILYSFYLYDQSSALLSKKAYRELLYTQKDDGSLYTTAPGIAFHLPDQNIAAMAMLWNYYLYTGDKDLLVELYPLVKKYIQYLESTANSDGMIILQEDVWNWIDWGDNKDTQNGSANTVCNSMYIVLLNSMINIADTLGIEADKTHYLSLQDKVKTNFNNYFWNGNAYVYHNINGQKSKVVDDRSNAWAVLAGMVDDTKANKVLDILTSKYNASPYQEMYVELAMLQLDPSKTLKRVRERYAAMIESWSSTLWEEFPAKNSNNHAWSAGPMYHLSAYFLGVRPTKPAYEEFTFLPLMGDLNEMSGDIPSPKGTISASCSINKETLTITQEINSPSDSWCIIGVPKKLLGKSITIKEIKAESTVIWTNGSSSGSLAGVEFYEEDDLFIKFKVQSGLWSFTSIGNEPSNVGILEIINPTTKIGLTDKESIKIKIINENKTERKDVPVSYTVNNGTEVTETIASIPAQSEIEYTFTKTADLLEAGEYFIAVKIQGTDDYYLEDDTLSALVSSYPEGSDWALLFTGEDGTGKINIPHADYLAFNAPFTIEAWVFPTGFKNNVWEGTVVSKETNNSGYALDIGGDGQARLVVYSDGWKEATAPAGSLVLNKWQHIAGKYNGSEIKIYVDGVFKAKASAGSISTATGPLCIGFSSEWAREFIGGIDEVRLWNKELSVEKINEYKDFHLTGDEENLVAYYRMNEGIGSSEISDLSSNNNTGIFNEVDTLTSWMPGISLPLLEEEISSTISTHGERIAQVYPNCTSDIVSIKFSNSSTNASIRVINLDGRTVYANNNIIVQKDDIRKVDISTFTKGVYFLVVNNSYTQKIMKIL